MHLCRDMEDQSGIDYSQVQRRFTELANSGCANDGCIPDIGI